MRFLHEHFAVFPKHFDSIDLKHFKEANCSTEV